MRQNTSGTHSVARNSITMLSGQLLGKGALFASLMMLSRYLDDTSFGMLVFAVALGQILIFLADLGVSLIANKKFSLNSDRIQEIYSTALGLRFLTSIASLALLMIVSEIAGYNPHQQLMIVFIGFGAALEAVTELQYAVFRARERMVYEALSRGAGGFTALLLALVVVIADLGSIAASATYTIRSMVILGSSLFFLRRFRIRIRPGFCIRHMLKLLGESWPLGVMGLLLVAFQRIDNVVIRATCSVEAVGAYQESYRILETFLLLITPSLLPGALFPGLCRSFAEGWEAARSKMVSIAQLVTGIAGAVMIPVLAGGMDFLRLVWGENYLRGLERSEVQTAFFILMAGIPAVFWMNFLVASIIARGKQWITMPVTAIALVLSLAGNILLVPRIGIPGAAIMVISVNFVMSLLYFITLRRDGVLPLLRLLWKPLIAVLVSVPMIFLTTGLPMIIRMIVPTSAYLITWFMLGGAEMLLRKQKSSSQGPGSSI